MFLLYVYFNGHEHLFSFLFQTRLPTEVWISQSAYLACQATQPIVELWVVAPLQASATLSITPFSAQIHRDLF